jgi:hypothetical protein
MDGCPLGCCVVQSADIDRRFRTAYFLQHQGDRHLDDAVVSYCETSVNICRLHDETCQKAAIFTILSVRTFYLMLHVLSTLEIEQESKYSAVGIPAFVTPAINLSKPAIFKERL